MSRTVAGSSASGASSAAKRLQVHRPLRRDDAVFRKMPAQGVDQLGALAHQEVARPEDHRPGLLIFGFHSNKPHCRPRRRLGDRLRVRRVVLLSLDERLDVDRRDKPDGMTEPLDLPAPEMRGGASFHRYGAGRQLRQEGEELPTPKLLAKDHIPARRCAMNLEHALHKIDADHANLFHGCPFLPG